MHIAARDSQPMMEINTTPLIDVMLVLLIMFIITIPIQSNAIKIDLPGPAPVLEPNALRNLLTIDADGTVRWNGQVASDASLVAVLGATRRMQPQPELHLRPDAAARYERVDDVLAMTKRAHVTRMGFVGNENYRQF